MSVFVVFETFGDTLKKDLDVDALEKKTRDVEGIAVSDQTPKLSGSYLIDKLEELRLQKAIPIQSVVAITGTRARIEEPLRRAMESMGLDPNCLVVVNVREQCAWVHGDREASTAKAERLVRAGIQKARMLTPLKRQVVDRFNGINTFADMLRVEPDPWNLPSRSNEQ